MRLSVLRLATVSVLSVAALATGLAQAALGTHAGRDVLVLAGLAFANQNLRGTVTVGAVDGSLLDGLAAHGVALRDSSGSPVATIDRLGVRYRLRDFLSGRIVLGEVELSGVRVTLERRAGERFNYETVLRLGEGTGRGRAPLVAFRNARLHDVLVAIRTPASSTDTVLQERTIRVAEAVLPYVRISSPFSGARGVRIEVAALQGESSAPALAVRDARGALEVIGDTIAVDFGTVRLAGTTTSMRGRFVLQRTLQVNLAFDAKRFTSDDVHALFPWLQAGITGAGRLTARHRSVDVLTVDARGLDLALANGGTVRGNLGLVLGPGETWETHGVDLRTDDFDLAYLRGMLDTVPMDGRLTGRTRADGPRQALDVQLDWKFHDRRADSAETSIRGAGIVAFGVPGDIVFHDLRLDTARIALATVHAISPAVALQGDLEGRGSLGGPWRNVTFTGTLAHRRDTLPRTRASGWVRLDLRRDTVGVWGDLTLDSLQWNALRPDYPSIPFRGGMAGHLHLAGLLDSLSVDGTLVGPRGSLDGHGTFVVVAPHLAARDLDFHFDSLVVAPIEERLPGTSLTGRLRGSYDADTLRAPIAVLDVQLAASRLGGARLDTAAARGTIADSVVHVDTLSVRWLGALLSGRGELPLAGASDDSLSLRLDAEAVAVLQPLLARLAPGGLLEGDSIGGEVGGTLNVSGSVAEPLVRWSVTGEDLRWNDLALHGVTTEGSLRWAHPAGVTASLGVARLTAGQRTYDSLNAAVSGALGSLHFLGTGRLGPYATLRAGGGLMQGDTVVLRFDSLLIGTASDKWRVPPGAEIRITPASVRLVDMRLSTADGRGVLALEGGLPGQEPDSLVGRGEGIPIADLWALLQFDPTSASGELAGSFRVAGVAADPLMDLAFSLRDAVFNEYRTPLSDGTVHYANRRLTGELNAWRAGTKIVTVGIDLPIDLQFGAVERRRLPGALSVRARADDVDLALLSAVSPLIRQTEGRLSLNVGIEGTWTSPRLEGFLSIQDGAVTLPTLGVRQRDLQGRLSLRGDTIIVDTLSAQSGAGFASVRGRVRLQELTQPVLDLQIRARDFRALDVPDFLTLVTSGDVQLRGPIFGAVLTGEGTIPRGVVHFADIIGKNVVDLSDTLMAMDSAAAAALRAGHLGPDFQSMFLDSVRIQDLKLTMGNDVHLRSSEADVFLTGQVLVQKQGKAYRLDGTLSTPRGTYQLYVGPTIRRQFTVTRGEVRYFGTPDLNAALDIDARHQLRGQRGENVVVYVHVGGTMLAPQLKLTSDVQPALTDEEIISYLVIGAPNVQAGRGVVGYGAQQMFSMFAAQVSGQVSSRVIADLGLPLDYLEIRPQIGVQGSNVPGNSSQWYATDVAVGRQISDRWFVTVSPRFCSGFTLQNIGASLEFRISRAWGLLASADPVDVCRVSTLGTARQQLGLDMLWEWRF
jgi:autotransporter translocation and assembly factor TamB